MILPNQRLIEVDWVEIDSDVSLLCIFITEGHDKKQIMYVKVNRDDNFFDLQKM